MLAVERATRRGGREGRSFETIRASSLHSANVHPVQSTLFPMDFSDEDLGTNYKDLVKSVRRDANDIYSRLRSIDEDAAFVRRVKGANPTLPLVGEHSFTFARFFDL